MFEEMPFACSLWADCMFAILAKMLKSPMCQKTSSENVVLSSKRRTSKTRANNQDFRINVVVFFLSPVGVLLRENNQAFCLHLHQAPCRLRLIIRTFFYFSF